MIPCVSQFLQGVPEQVLLPPDRPSELFLPYFFILLHVAQFFDPSLELPSPPDFLQENNGSWDSAVTRPSGSFLSAPSARQLTTTQCLWVIDGNFSSSFSPMMVQTSSLIVFLIILNFDTQKEVSDSHSVSVCD